MIDYENACHFLDVLIKRSDNGLITDVYRKETFIGLVLNFVFFVPIIYKNSLLLHKANYICSYCLDRRIVELKENNCLPFLQMIMAQSQRRNGRLDK